MLNPNAGKPISVQQYLEWQQCINWKDVQDWHKKYTPWITDYNILREYYNKRVLDFEQSHKQLIEQLQDEVKYYKEQADKHIKAERLNMEELKAKIDLWDNKQVDQSQLNNIVDQLKLYGQETDKFEQLQKDIEQKQDMLQSISVSEEKVFEYCLKNKKIEKEQIGPQIQDNQSQIKQIIKATMI